MSLLKGSGCEYQWCSSCDLGNEIGLMTLRSCFIHGQIPDGFLIFTWSKQFFSFQIFGGHGSFLLGHWYPCFGLLVTSPLGFKVRVGSALFELSRGVHVMLHVPWDSPLVWHLPTYWRPAWQLSRLFHRGFHKYMTLAIMPILASEALLHENKKI